MRTYYIKYTSHEFSPECTIWETLEDCSKERKIYDSEPLDMKDVVWEWEAMPFNLLSFKKFDIKVLTKDEYFLEMI